MGRSLRVRLVVIQLVVTHAAQPTGTKSARFLPGFRPRRYKGLMLVHLFLAFGASLVLCLLLTPAARAVAFRFELVDRPYQRRKMHTRTVPVAGGLPILFSTCTALGAMLLLSPALAALCEPEGL